MTARRVTRKQMRRDEFVTAVGRLTEWMEGHARETLIGIGIAVLLAVGVILVFRFLGQREEKASLLLARGIEQELLPMCLEFRLAVVPYNPLAGGLLTGKHTSAAPLSGTRFDLLPFYRDRYWHQANFEAVQKLSKIAADAGRSLTRLALGWLLQQPAVTSVIVGASRLEQLQENLAALDDGPLSAETLAACDEVWRALRGVTPQYNR